MNFNEQYPASFDNYPRPSKMKRPNVSSIATGAATRFIGYIGDQLESILIDKYGKTRGEKTFEGLLNNANDAIYTVCTDIIKEKIKMFQDLGIPDSEYMNKDYFDTNYYALWSKWMDEFVKKPYSHLIKKEEKINKLKESIEKLSGKKVKLVEGNIDNVSPYAILFTVTRKKPISYKELRIESPRSIIEQYAIANFKDPKDFRGMATKIKEYIKSLPIINLTSHKLPYDDFPSNTPTTPFIGIRKNGNAKQVYFIDPQGYNYAKYILRLN